MTPGGRFVRLAMAAVIASTLLASGHSPQAKVISPRQPIAAGTGVLAAPLTGPSRLPSTSTTARPAAPAFASSVSGITPAVRARMGTSWRPGCPVPLAELRYLQVSHWGFDHAVHRGELVVNVRAVDPVVRALRSLFEVGFPLVRMQLIDPRGGGDSAARAAEGTAAFNCRPATGRPGVWSQHSYGLAIDVNPVQNPYVGRSGAVEPVAARAYLDRSRREPGMIHADDVVVRAFAAVGWGWGGHWTSIKDYQHFSATGR